MGNLFYADKISFENELENQIFESINNELKFVSNFEEYDKINLYHLGIHEGYKKNKNNLKIILACGLKDYNSLLEKNENQRKLKIKQFLKLDEN